MTDEERDALKAVHGELFDDLVRVYEIRTICEVLREIYWGVKDKEIREKVKEAMVMAKKMDKRLVSYYLQAHPGESHKGKYNEGLFKPNPFKDVKRLEKALEEIREDRGDNVCKG